MPQSLTLKQVKEALVHLAKEVLRESVMLTKDRAGNADVFRDVLYITLASDKDTKLYVGQLLFVTGDKETGDELHKEMMEYLNFQGHVLGQGRVHKSFSIVTPKEEKNRGDGNSQFQ